MMAQRTMPATRIESPELSRRRASARRCAFYHRDVIATISEACFIDGPAPPRRRRLAVIGLIHFAYRTAARGGSRLPRSRSWLAPRRHELPFYELPDLPRRLRDEFHARSSLMTFSPSRDATIDLYRPDLSATGTSEWSRHAPPPPGGPSVAGDCRPLRRSHRADCDARLKRARETSKRRY